jgi:hypothetical protein
MRSGKFKRQHLAREQGSTSLPDLAPKKYIRTNRSALSNLENDSTPKNFFFTN